MVSNAATNAAVSFMSLWIDMVKVASEGHSVRRNFEKCFLFPA